MSHEFESGFVVREAAWHGLATVLEDAPSIEDAIKIAKLDWDVVPHDIQLVQDKPIVIEGYKAMVRSTDNSVLGIVSDRYVPLQNREAFAFFQKFLDDKQCVLESAGSLKSGRNVWVLAKIIGQEKEIVKGDEIIPYLLVTTAHDGTKAVLVSFTPIRVVCWNTLSWAENLADKSATRNARVMHVGDVKASLMAVQKEIDFAKKTIGNLVEQANVLRQKELDGASFYKFLEQVYGPEREELRKQLKELYIKRDDTALSKKAKDVVLEEIQKIEEKLATPVRRAGTIQILTELLDHGPGAELAGKTVWGAYMAVTHYEEHLRAGSNEARLASSWFGGSTETIRERALATALAM